MSDQHHDHDDQPPSPVDRQQQQPLHWPTTVADAVDRLIAVLSAVNQQLIRDEPDVIAFHFTLGMWIRNASASGRATLRSTPLARSGGGIAANPRFLRHVRYIAPFR